jgi:prepilin-type N-terminal cleavage/methylation domain-containing protein
MKRRRAGFSLLEVLLALAILGTSLAAISILVRLGSRSAVNAREVTTAQLLCEAKLAEITSGMLPADPGGPWQFDLPEHAGWVYYVDLQPLPQPGLMSMNVTVMQDLGPTNTTQKPLSFTLVRWIQDPGLELPEEPTPTDTSTTGSTTAAPATTGGASGP